MKILCGTKLEFDDCEDVFEGFDNVSVKTDDLAPEIESPTVMKTSFVESEQD